MAASSSRGTPWRQTFASSSRLVLEGDIRSSASLYDDRGDREKAAEHHAAFVELWRNADPDLQTQVADARRCLARLREIESAKR